MSIATHESWLSDSHDKHIWQYEDKAEPSDQAIMAIMDIRTIGWMAFMVKPWGYWSTIMLIVVNNAAIV